MNATSTNASATLESRLRQIAILVASVDTVAARQVLMQLPTEIAKRVRAMAADLGPVPPEERRALLAEFQKSQSQLRSPASLQSNASSSNRAQAEMAARAFADYGSPSPLATDPTFDNDAPSWTRLGVETLVRLVKTERPTVIAVVLQQLPAAQVAAVLQRLPRSITKDVLQTLGSMHDIDEEAMKAIDEHLSERLRDYHHKIETEIEQNRRMNELLALAPPELKQQWASWMRPDVYVDENGVQSTRPVSATASALNTLDRLYQSATITTSDTAWNTRAAAASMHPSMNVEGASPQSSPSGHSVAASNSQPTWSSANSQTTQKQPLNAAALHSRSLHTQPINPGVNEASSSVASRSHPSATPTAADEEFDDGPRTIPFPSAKNTEAPVMSVAERKLLHARMDKLLKLNPDLLAQLLSSLDSQTILLALAGASPSFMRRFSSMLEPEDAKVLDQRIKRIGSVNLRDIDAAQLRLVQRFESQSTTGNSNQPVQQRRAA